MLLRFTFLGIITPLLGLFFTSIAAAQVPDTKFAKLLNTPAGPHLRWGGLHLNRVSAKVQEQLGLPEHQGMLVVGVEANSPAAKVGLKKNDVLVKLNDKVVPNDIRELALMVKELPANKAFDLVVVRDGKEETLKEIKLPPALQRDPQALTDEMLRRFGLNGLNMPGLPPMHLNPNPGFMPGPVLPFQLPRIEELNLEMKISGARIVRKQTLEEFSGEYVKDKLKLSVKGRLANGLPKISDITVEDTTGTRKYTRLLDVPVQHRLLIQRLLLPTSGF